MDEQDIFEESPAYDRSRSASLALEAAEVLKGNMPGDIAMALCALYATLICDYSGDLGDAVRGIEAARADMMEIAKRRFPQDVN